MGMKWAEDMSSWGNKEVCTMLLFAALVVLAVGLIVGLAMRMDADMDAGGLKYGVYAGLGFMGAFGCMDYMLLR